MKLKNLFFPIVLVIVIALMYFFYFAPQRGLGSFSSFDTNNSANKEIRVKVVQAKGIEQNEQSGAVFTAVDKEGTEVLVQAPYPLPEGFDKVEFITMNGHLHPDHFHAVSVEKD